MRPPRVPPPPLRWLRVAASGLTLAGLALTAGPVPRCLADDLPVALVVNSDSGELTFGRVRESLALALQAEVVPVPAEPTDVRGTVTITWRPSRRELAVTYQAGRRGAVGRIVSAPADADGALTSATALAANLVRDEAAELLGEDAPPEIVAEPSPTVVLSAPPPPPQPARPYSTVVASMFYPLASNHQTPDVRTRLALNAFYGRVGQLDGLQVGFGANQVDGPVIGAQVGLAFNIAGDSVGGFQAAFALNHAEGPVSGFQASLGLNRSAGGRGLQASLGLNRAAGPWRGLQAAAINVAEDVTGGQLGLVNVAGHVRGVQLGLINVADDVEGIPIGLISVTESGGVHPVLWTGSQSVATLGLKFSTRYTYTMVSGAARREGGQNLFGPGFSLGVRVPFLPGYFESDIGAHFLFGGPLCCVSARVGLADDLLLGRWRSLLGFQVHHRFSLFGGAALTAIGRFHEPTDDRTIELVPELFGGVQL